MTTVAEALRRGGDRLEAMTSDAPRLQARLLLSRVTGQDAVWIYQNPHVPLSYCAVDRFDCLIEQRLTGEPLRYLIGNVEFFGRSFAVDRRVLVPRPETEELVEYALGYAMIRRARLRPVRIAFDVGTGSGVLAITLATSLPETTVVAIDRSWDALEVAAANAKRLGVRGQTLLLQADLLTAIDTTADLIVANLPYVPQDDLDGLPVEVRREPRIALNGGSDGLDVYRRFFAQCERHLATPGLMITEIGDGQANSALDLISSAIPDAASRILVDSSGRNRFVVAERTEANGTVIDPRRASRIQAETRVGEFRD